MPLQPQSPANHNEMLGRLIKHPKSTNYDGDADLNPRSPKRRKVTQPNSSPSKKITRDRVIPDSEDDSEDELDSVVPTTSKTDLESALPPVVNDQEAIEAYEAFRASQTAEETEKQEPGSQTGLKGRSSIYVDAFKLALDTVLDEESHLFSNAEKAVFDHWRCMTYEAQHLYVRLFLRKTAAWHRVATLGYHSDIPDLQVAIDALQKEYELPSSSSSPTSFFGEGDGSSEMHSGESYTFADKSEKEITTFEEASSLLKLDELKTLAKDAKVSGKNKKELLGALRRTSKKQSGLGGWVPLRRSDTDASTGSNQTLDPADGTESPPLHDMSESSRDAHFTRKILEGTGSCIRLSEAPLKLFERVHLVFYRSTEWTEKSLTTIILAKIARRNFPDYIVSRSASIFASRSLLLEFEASLRTQFRVDNILEFNGPPTKDDLQGILDLWEDIYPRWRKLLEEEQKKEDSIYMSGEGAYLRRLSPAWVYTRIAHKAAYVLGKFKHHKREHALLTELLTQQLFHASRRGAWYQRKALLEEHYMANLTDSDGRSDEVQKKHWKRIALHTCEDGLQDRLVHLMFHYDLQKRITKLEKALRVAKREQHDFSHVRLATPVEVYVEGTRVERDASAPTGRRYSSPHPGLRRSTRTIWLDPLADNAECTVEAMALSHYRTTGWKGYHSEGGIMRTLFAYMFFDVMFIYVPNVFQTPFQTCPLDLHTDAFYPSRLSEVNSRLAQISNGEAEDILMRVWEDHHEKQTCVVGLDWTFDLVDLQEVISCFDPDALATICKVYAQEYGQRGGGMPDLFLWHPEVKTIKFSEVKSENDRLSDTQRLWIHVLTGAGIRVELCNAVAKHIVEAS